MRGSKRTRDFSGPLRLIDDELSDRLTMMTPDEQIGVVLQDLLTVHDAKQQLDLVKSITRQVRQRVEEANQSECPIVIVVVDVFINIYMDVDPQHPIKRVITSSLQSLPECLHSCIKNAFCSRLRQHVFIPGSRGISIGCLRHRINIIGGLLDNFSLGEMCIQEMFIEVCLYLAEALETFLHAYSPSLPPIELNELMTHCHVTQQTTNKMLQKCVMSVDPGNTSLLEDAACRFLTCSTKILTQDSFLLDTRCGAGISLGLFLSLLCKGDVVPLVLHCVFPEFRVENSTPKPLPHWLTASGSDRLGNLDLSLTSHLCVCQGLLAVLEGEDLLTEFAPDRCLLVDVLLPELLSQTYLDSVPKLLVAKALVLWTTRALSVVESACKGGYSPQRFHGEGPVIQQLLNFAWSTWEDPVDLAGVAQAAAIRCLTNEDACQKPALAVTATDLSQVAIRANSRQIFDKALRLHLLASSQPGGDDTFLLSLVMPLLSLSWSVKGKYGPLICLVEYIGANRLLKLHPNLPTGVLGALQEHALACYASELFEKLCQVNLVEIEKGKELADAWEKNWVDPVLAVLCGNNRVQKVNVLEYVLPRLLKIKKDVLTNMIKRLSTQSSGCDNSENLGALVMCMKRARAVGQLGNGHGAKNGSRMFDVIKPGLLKKALSCCDDQVRLDAFALLCENKKTSEAIEEREFELIRFFLCLNMNNQSAAFRQTLLSFLKRLLVRMGESAAAILRKSTSSPAGQTKHEDIHHYKVFSDWLVEHLLSCLFPGAGFARKTTALSALSLLMDMFFPNKKAQSSLLGEFLVLNKLISGHDIRSLLECLTDKFEDNKSHSYKILCHLLKEDFIGKWDTDWPRAMFESALTLCVSTKPQDCTTAAYIFRVVVKHPSFPRLVLDYLPQRADFTGDTENLSSSDHRHNGQSLYPQLDPSCQSHTVSLLLMLLLDRLRDQVTVARDNLLKAAASGPIYPVIHCIRYLLTDLPLSCVKTDVRWRSLLADLIQCCCDAAEVVSPVVQNSSPEGNIPLEAIKGGNLGLTLGTSEGGTTLAEGSVEKDQVGLMPEYLVVCCWRTTKEVSLLLGQIAVQAPVIPPGGQEQAQGMISYQQILDIGQYFINQLLESKHRGAFEMAYAGFITMMDMLWRNPIDCVRELPEKWLSQVMQDIQSESGKSKLCATRRSAGVPFFVQAVLGTEPDIMGRSKFKLTMTQLLGLALQREEYLRPNTDAQVHAVNILRALYCDSQLSKDVTPSLADGLKVAILGFSSSDWAIRNASTLLFSALITRIFGVKRSKDQCGAVRKNCLTGRNFFQRFPSLYPFLLKQLEDATCNIGVSGHLHLHPGLYPVLMVLGRLVPSVMEGGDTSLNMATFVPHIIRCSGSPVLKIRLIAARALQPLVFKDQVISVLTDIMDRLPNAPGVLPQSHIHGLLLQLHEVLSYQDHFCHTIRERLACQLPQRIVPKLWMLTSSNKCVLTRKVMLETVTRVLRLPSPDNPTHQEMLRTRVRETLVAELSQFGCYYPHTPALIEYLVTVTQLYLSTASPSPERLVSLLTCEHYEVRLAVLEHLHTCVTPVAVTSLGRVEVAKMDTEAVIKATSDTHFDTNNTSVRGADICTDTRRDTSDKHSAMWQHSPSLFAHLIAMVFGQETWEPCLAKVLEVLSLYPCLPEVLEKEQFDTSKIFSRAVEVAQDSENEDLKCSAILFNSAIFSLIYQEVVTQSYCAGMTAGDLVQRWVSLLESCCQSEQCEEVKLSVAGVIVSNAHLLLIDPHAVLGSGCMNMWEMTFLLLEDEDAEVRERMTSILPTIDPNIADPASALLTVDVLLGKMLDTRLSADPQGCVALLLGLMTRDTSCLQDGQLGVFDKSEMNTYSEDVTMATTAAKHLGALIKGERETTDDGDCYYGDQDVISYKMKSSLSLNATEDCLKSKEHIRVFPSKELLTVLVKEAVVNICEKLETVLIDEYGGCWSLEDVYLRTSRYEWSVCLIFRLVLALIILTSAEVFRHTAQSQRVLQKAREVMSSHTWNNLIAKHLSSVSSQINYKMS